MTEKLKPDFRRISLKQLRVLPAVMQVGTISGAAKILNITPSAATLQMRQLADAAGMPLVERTNEGLRASEAGQEMIIAATRIEAALADCFAALEALGGLENGSISVGVVNRGKFFAPQALASFAQTHPKVEIRLRVGNRKEITAGLRNCELDFAVMGSTSDNLEVEKALIGDHPHIVVGPNNHPMAQHKQIALAEFAKEVFLVRERGSGTRRLMKRMFSQAGINPNFGMEIDSNETLKQAVIAGLGIAFISAHTVSSEIQDGRLVAFNINELPLIRQWFVVKQQGKRLLPAAQALWDFLVISGADHLPNMCYKG